MWLPDYLHNTARAKEWGGIGWLCCEAFRPVSSPASTELKSSRTEFERLPGIVSLLALEKLGSGAQGTALKVVSSADGKIAVCKIPDPTASPDGLNRFLKEVSLLADHPHRHVVRFWHRVEVVPRTPNSPRLPACLIEFIAGGSLDRLLGKRKDGTSLRRLPVIEALRIVAEVISALQWLHSRRVRHRDLKPANVLFDVDKGRSVRLCDFGVAKEDDGTRSSETLAGTPDYLAPEFVQNRGAVDFRADYFSLGCMLYEMLLGELPYKGVIGHYPTASSHVPTGFAEIRDKHGDAVHSLVLALLRTDPATRLTNAGELQQKIESILQTPAPCESSYWETNWPRLDGSLDRQLQPFLLHDARLFSGGRLPQLGALVALHAERVALDEFSKALADIHTRIWHVRSQLRGLDKPSTAARLRQGREDFERSWIEIQGAIRSAVPEGLRKKLNHIVADKPLVERIAAAEERMSRTFAGPIREEEANLAELTSIVGRYRRDSVGVWRDLHDLRSMVADRIVDCSDLLMATLARLRRYESSVWPPPLEGNDGQQPLSDRRAD